MFVYCTLQHMVHLAVPLDAESYRGQPGSSDPEREPHAGAAAADTSLESSGFYGTDMEDRDRGEEGTEEPERRTGEDEWDRDVGEDRERQREGETRIKDVDELRILEANHTTPDLDTLIG